MTWSKWSWFSFHSYAGFCWETKFWSKNGNFNLGKAYTQWLFMKYLNEAQWHLSLLPQHWNPFFTFPDQISAIGREKQQASKPYDTPSTKVCVIYTDIIGKWNISLSKTETCHGFGDRKRSFLYKTLLIWCIAIPQAWNG